MNNAVICDTESLWHNAFREMTTIITKLHLIEICNYISLKSIIVCNGDHTKL